MIRPSPSTLRHSTSLFALFAFCIFVLTGCSLFRPAPFVQEVPANLESHPGVAQMRNGPDRPAGLNEAFPNVGEFIASTRVTATQRRFLVFKFSSQLDASLISGDANSLRMVARHPGDATTVLDMMVAENKMRVYLPLSTQAFQGELQDGVSPLGAKFGVEPWDLRPVFSIGQKLVETQPNWEKRENKDGETEYLLLPATPDLSGGLQSVLLDSKTGLPREAVFIKGKARWTAEYLGWDLFKNSEDAYTAWLMPSHIIVRNRKPRVTLEITLKQYRMNPSPDPRRWTLNVPLGTPMFTLDDLRKGLGKL